MSQKKKISLMILFILIWQIIFPAFNVMVENFFTVKSYAIETTVDGIDWNLYVIDGIGIIEPKEKENLPKNIVIPDKIENYEVNEINKLAFEGCTNIETVQIPSTVTKIGNSAFHRCFNLKSIAFSEGLKIIGINAFGGCRSIESVELPSTVEEIGNSAFNNTFTVYGVEETALKNIVLNEGLKVIGNHAFDNAQITSLEIPPSVEKIGNYAFDNCEKLQNVKLNEGLKEIGERAFQWTGIRKISVPRSVEKIGDFFAFYTDVNNGKPLVTVYCYKDSYAEQYCKDNGYNYIIKNITKIEIVNGPEKTNYVEDENFDKKEMTVKATYNDGEERVITDYEIVNGTNLALGQENVIISYTEDGITKTATQNITVEEKLTITLNTYQETEDQKFIKDISVNTTIEQFVENIITNGTIELYDGIEKITDYKTKLKTGMKLKVFLNDLVLENKIVVKGDTNGDGEANVKDILQINKHRLGKITLTNEFLLAGDVNKDNNVDIKDILQINKYRLGKIQNL